MVGVPGRSKGCNTCIQRKIKCDQGTPCGNCQKSKRLCSYKRKLAYVFSKNVNISTPADLSNEEGTVTHRERWRKPGQPSPHRSPPVGYQFAQPLPAGSASTLSAALADAVLTHQVSGAAAFRQQFHHIFIHQHLPTEMLRTSWSVSSNNPNFLLRLQDIKVPSPALEAAITAFFAVRLARMNKDLELVHRSRGMYLSGLKALQESLRNPRTRLSDETLAACVTLSLYELSERPEGPQLPYRTHEQGAMALLHLRGPDACTSPLALSMLLWLRTQTLYPSIIRRHETFLAHREWLENPWSQVSKPPFDQINDLLFMLPVVYRQIDRLMDPRIDAISKREGLLKAAVQFSNLLSSTEEIYEKLQKSTTGPLYWPEFSTFESNMDDTKLGKVFPVSFHFPAFTVGQTVCTYWSGTMAFHKELMHVYYTISRIEASMGLAKAQDTFIKACQHGNEWRTAARNICQSSEYFLQDNMGGLGPISILALLRGCKACFQSDEQEISPESGWAREVGWTAEVMEKLEARFTFPIGSLIGADE